MAVLEWTDDLTVGMDFVDAEHKEFIELVNLAAEASDDALPEAMSALVRHTRLHFGHEEAMMRATGFFAYPVHKSEHERVLGELERAIKLMEAGGLDVVRTFVRKSIPEWFEIHRNTMDQVTASFGAARIGRDWRPE